MAGNKIAALRTELAAARQDLDRADDALERAEEHVGRGDSYHARNALAAVNALLHDARRVTSMLIRDVEQAVREQRKSVKRATKREPVGVGS